MRIAKYSLTGALCLTACFALAQVGERLLQKYKGSLSDISIARRNINELRNDIEHADAADIIASAREASVTINRRLPDQFALVEDAMRSETMGLELSLSVLSERQRQEFISTIAIVDPEQAGSVEESGAISDTQLAAAIFRSMAAVNQRGRMFLEFASNERNVGLVQLEKAEFSLTMGRFERLIDYFIIFVSRRPE